MKTRILLILAVASLYFSQNALPQTADSAHVRKTNPTGALLRSAFVPGLGQFYNRKYIKAAIFAGTESWLIYGIHHDWKMADRHEANFKQTSDPIYKASEFSEYEKARDSRNLKMWILAAAIFYSMFDAYVDGQLSDFEQRDKAYEVFIGPTENEGVQLVMKFDIP